MDHDETQGGWLGTLHFIPACFHGYWIEFSLIKIDTHHLMRDEGEGSLITAVQSPANQHKMCHAVWLESRYPCYVTEELREYSGNIVMLSQIEV